MTIRAGRLRPRNAKILFWTQPDSYWDVVLAHLPIALLTGLGLLLPLWVSLQSLPLINCTFLTVTGFPCPFCGFTRSLWAISGGEWGFALSNCPLSSGIYGLMVLFFVWHGTALLLGVRMTSGLYRISKLRYFWGMVAALFLLNWFYRIALGKM